MALNNVTLMGRFTRDPEINKTANDISVLSFSLAVDKPYNKENDHPEANFIDCVVWRERADAIAKYFKKGDRIAITGILQTRNWEDKDGNKRKSTEVVVNTFEFVERKSDSGTAEDKDAPSAKSNPAPAVEADGDDDYPF